jgi:hypothetical protein
MTRFACVENNQIIEGPMFLPKNWRNVSGLDLLSVDDLRLIGWLPWRFVEIQAEVITGSSVQITDTEIVETQTGRDRTPEENQEILNQWRKSVSVSPLQIRRALRAVGLLDEINAFVESSSVEVREAWEYAIQIDRTNEMLLDASSAMGMSDLEVDDLFRLALTL